MGVPDTPVGRVIKSAEIGFISPMPSRGNSDIQKTQVEHFHYEEHNINKKVSNTSKILTSAVAGASAGAIAKTVIAPLDRTKINFQTRNIPFSFSKAIQFLVDCKRSEGITSLWRGNSATMVRIVPYAAIQYVAHEQFKTLLKKDPQQKHLPPGRRVLAGSLAGVLSVIFTYPFDMVRARMAITLKKRYNNLIVVILKICREEGFLTLFRGLTPTILGVIPYAGTSFGVYETLKKRHAERTHGRDLTTPERLCFGALAGALGQSASYPLDIIRRRMQTAGVTGHSQDYTSIFKTAKSVIQDEGFRRGMYKGLSMNWIKGPIAVGISFTAFETIQLYLRKLDAFQL